MYIIHLDFFYIVNIEYSAMRETKLYYYVLAINTILTIHRLLKKTTLIRFLQHKIQRVPGNPTIDWDHVLTLEGCFV